MLSEHLESRAMLSANAFIGPAGVLHVRGFLQAANTIVVGNSADGTKVDVSVTAATKNGTKTFTASLDKSKVKSVAINGGRKADTVTIDQTNSPFAFVTRAQLFAGADTYDGGDNRDVVQGQGGDDTLNGNGGDDALFGRVGDDALNGGAGNDVMWGGLGDDAIDGGEGDDKLGGVLGANTLLGGAGNDIFVVRSLEANPTNDFLEADDILYTRGNKLDVA
jgi:Ca2+-binding RTX toxin-like protein